MIVLRNTSTTIHQGQSRVTILCPGDEKIGNEFLSPAAQVFSDRVVASDFSARGHQVICRQSKGDFRGQHFEAWLIVQAAVAGICDTR